jgi:APA family basic amino acid/polyamine antiporter
VVALAVTALLVIGTTESARVNAFLVADQGHGPDRVRHPDPALDQERQLHALHSQWLVRTAWDDGHGRVWRRGLDLLRLCGLRRGLDRSRRNQEPAAQRADRPDRQPGDLHHLLPAGRGRRDRRHRRPTACSAPPAKPCNPVRPRSTPACGLAANADRLVCSNEALAHVLRQVNFPLAGYLLGLAANLALPSVILMMIYGQTRIFFVMARDGLLPEKLAAIHPKFKTPHIVTIATGIFVAIAAAFFPVGQLADISNSGTCSPSSWWRSR